uniref:Uncharacterized protein n=1 Tax=Coccidioides posadasii RMSCC 3488 TaxID=454284 RepID=A0A0J6FG80_COCPO|nr:hypothetical protein CPAG_08425 [Coccidioides posadasii RMSCC 3488]
MARYLISFVFLGAFVDGLAIQPPGDPLNPQEEYRRKGLPSPAISDAFQQARPTSLSPSIFPRVVNVDLEARQDAGSAATTDTHMATSTPTPAGGAEPCTYTQDGNTLIIQSPGANTMCPPTVLGFALATNSVSPPSTSSTPSAMPSSTPESEMTATPTTDSAAPMPTCPTAATNEKWPGCKLCPSGYNEKDCLSSGTQKLVEFFFAFVDVATGFTSVCLGRAARTFVDDSLKKGAV